MKINIILGVFAVTLTTLLLTGCGWHNQASESPQPITIIKPVAENIDLSDMGPKSSVGRLGLQQNTYSKTGWDSWVDVSQDGRYIVYSSTAQTGNPDIFVKTINGTAMSQKTASVATDIQPTISPDGKLIAFASNRNGNYDIYITSAWSNGPLWQVSMSSADEMSPSWSHDGTKIAYCAKTTNGVWELWTLDLSTLAHTNLGPGMNPKWHPSKYILAYQKLYNKDGISSSICTIDASGRNLNVIVRGERWCAIQPAWSPDGTRIAFSSLTDKAAITPTTRGGDIYVINIDGSQQMRITENSGDNWSPSWGIVEGVERIYFTSNRDSKINIWSVRTVKYPMTPVMHSAE